MSASRPSTARFDEVYQLAADMGGAGYIFTGEHDADIMHNSATINLNVLDALPQAQRQAGVLLLVRLHVSGPQPGRPGQPELRRRLAYPAAPDSEYGWEKLFSERLYLAYNRNHGMHNRVARYHNIFGPQGTWQGGKEKAPAAICRKVASARDGGEIEIWGDGEQTRSFLYIDECIEGTLRLTRSDFEGPVNIGSEEMVTINQLVDMVVRHRRQAAPQESHPGPAGRARAELRQPADRREARLGAVAAADCRAGEDLRLDRTAGPRQPGRARSLIHL